MNALQIRNISFWFRDRDGRCHLHKTEVHYSESNGTNVSLITSASPKDGESRTSSKSGIDALAILFIRYLCTKPGDDDRCLVLEGTRPSVAAQVHDILWPGGDGVKQWVRETIGEISAPEGDIPLLRNWVVREGSSPRANQRTRIFILPALLSREQVSIHYQNQVVSENFALRDLENKLLKKWKTRLPSEPSEKKTCFPCTDHLPATGRFFVGREPEMAQIDRAIQSPTQAVFSVVGFGGTGKSALINQWLERSAKREYDGLESIFGYSFYNQGTDNRKTIASDEFFELALQHLAPDVSIPANARERGRMLAAHVINQKSLLILDGLEPLQSHTEATLGKVQDEGIHVFLKSILTAPSSRGLCLISTRIPIPQLAPYQERSAREIPLPKVGLEKRIQLLKNLGVVGSMSQLVYAAEELGSNLLALTLFGNLVSQEPYRGSITRFQESHHDTSAACQSQKAWMVLDYYQSHLTNSEKAVMQMLSLFDRPISATFLRRILNNQTVPIWRDMQTEASEKGAFIDVISGLIQKQLLSYNIHEKLETHPMIRGYFANQLKSHHPKSFRRAHAVVYRILTKSVKSFRPDDRQDLRTLLGSVRHGVLAGKFNRTFLMYWFRVNRGALLYGVRKHGTIKEDLAALSHFFQGYWEQAVPSINAPLRPHIHYLASLLLSVDGRSEEASGLAEREFGSNEKFHSRYLQTCGASLRAFCYYSQGAISEAREVSNQSLRAIQSRWSPLDHVRVKMLRIGKPLILLTNGSFTANMILLAGDIQGAVNLYEETWKDYYTKTKSITKGPWGYGYWVALSFLGRPEEALEDIRRSLHPKKNSSEAYWCDHENTATIGATAAAFAQIIQHEQGKKQNLKEIIADLRNHINFLFHHHLPWFAPECYQLIIRCHRLRGDRNAVAEELPKFHDMITGRNPIYLSRFYLETAWNQFHLGEPTKAHHYLTRAEECIEKTQNRLLSGEVAQIRSLLDTRNRMSPKNTFSQCSS